MWNWRPIRRARSVRQSLDRILGRQVRHARHHIAGILREAAALRQGSTGRARADAARLLADAFQLAGHFANNLSARDLAYATIVYAQQVVQDASDELRAGRLDAVLSWIYLRDGDPTKAMKIAEKQQRGSNHASLTATSIGWQCSATS